MNEELLQLAYSKIKTDADFETFKADFMENEDLQRLVFSRMETNADFETFKADLMGEKKNQVGNEAVPATQEGMESNLEDGSSDSQDTDENGFWSDSWKAIKANTKTALAGLAGIPNAINKGVVSIFMPDDLEEYLNSISPDQREDFVNNLLMSTGGTFGAGSMGLLGKLGSDKQEELIEESDKIRQQMKQFDTAITEDIVNGDLGQAAWRAGVEGIGSIPSIIQSIIPYVGLASVASGSAANKMERLEDEGEEMGFATTANAVVTGAIEGLLEKYTQKQGKKIWEVFSGKADDVIRKGMDSFIDGLKEVGKGMAGEGFTEGLQATGDKLADLLISGREVDFMEAIKEIGDNFVVGAVAGGGMKSVQVAGQVAKQRIEERQERLGDQPIEQTPEYEQRVEDAIQPLPEGERVELNIPAVDEDGNEIDYVLEDEAVQAPPPPSPTPEERPLPAEQEQLPAEQRQLPDTPVEEQVEDGGRDTGDYFEAVATDAKEMSESQRREEGRGFMNTLRSIFTTSRPEIEQALRQNKMQKSEATMNTVAGHRAAIGLEVDTNLKLQSKLSTKKQYTHKNTKGEDVKVSEKDIFNNLVKANAIIGIEQRYESDPEGNAHLADVKHMGGVTPKAARNYVAKMRETLPEDVFNRLMNTVRAYDMRFEDLLVEGRNEGIIHPKIYEQLKDFFYSPRKVLEFLIENQADYDDALFREDKLVQQLNKQLSDFKQRIKQGTEKLDEMDAFHLLNLYTAGQQARIFKNRASRAFADEFQERQNNYEQLTPKQKERFDKLQQKVKFDEVMGFKNGKPVYKYKKTPYGFTPIYFYRNGEQGRFFMRTKLAEQFMDIAAKPNRTGQEILNALGWIFGSKPLKIFATGVNIAFMINNIPMEFVHAANVSEVYSNNMLLTYPKLAKDYFKGMVSSYKKDEDYRNFIKHGGGQLFKTLEARRIMVRQRTLDKLRDKMPTASFKKFTRVFEAAMELQKATEEGIRLAIFKRSMKKQMDAYLKNANLPVKQGESGIPNKKLTEMYIEAADASRKVADFNRGSAIMKATESFIPYSNITAQATDAVLRAYKERPVGTMLRQIQTAAFFPAVMMSLSYLFVSMFNDEEDKSFADIVAESENQQSRYTQDKYGRIHTGIKGEDGMYITIPIRKVESIAFLTNMAEEMLIREVTKDATNAEYIQREFVGLATESAAENFYPFPVKPKLGSEATFGNNVTKVIGSIPLFSAGMAFHNVDAYSGRKLVYTDKPEYLEGRDNPRIEPLFKGMAEMTNESPIRLQKAVESYITTPSTNPLVGYIYETGNMVANLLKGEEVDPEDALIAPLNAIKRRLVKEGSEYNIVKKLDTPPTQEEINADVALDDFSNSFNAMFMEYLEGGMDDATFEMKTNEAIERYSKDVPDAPESEIMEVMSDLVRKIERRQKISSPTVYKIAFAYSNRQKARKLFDYFGDALTDEKIEKFMELEANREIVEELDAMGVFNEHVIYYYNNMVE